jgi:hypothetical protein
MALTLLHRIEQQRGKSKMDSESQRALLYAYKSSSVCFNPYILTHFWKSTQYKDALGRSKMRSCWRERTWGQWPTFGKTMKSSTVSNCPYALPRATGSQGSFSPHAINVGTWEAKWKPLSLLLHKIRKLMQNYELRIRKWSRVTPIWNQC